VKNDTFGHRPVLLDECIEALRIRPGGIYVDGTLGRGGHAREILRRLGGGRLICIDRDEEALLAANEAFQNDLDKVILVRGNFREIESILSERNIAGVDGMLFDLGVSSPQLDDFGRGFSYMHDAPLDMRMDRRQSLTARTVVNEWPEEELKRILYEYGEERYAPAIARAIVKARAQSPLESTAQLSDLIRSSMPAASRREQQHPAKRSFQAIRIAVNDELNAVAELIPAAVKRLNPGGRLAMISFHSLEDRIVKNALAILAKGCECQPDFPVCVCGKKPLVRLITRKPVVPGENELRENPRARSAKLRVAERL